MRAKFTIEPCQTCGTPFRLKAYRAADPERGKFCSRDCYWTHKRTVRIPLADRFWPKIDKNGPIPEHRPELGSCWLWTGSRHPKGYGYISEGGREGSDLRAPRVAWMLTYGPIEDGLWVLHHCDNPSCCNPEHLWLGTAAQNTDDMMRKGRHFTQRTVPHSIS